MSPHIHTALQTTFTEWPETVGGRVPEIEIVNAEKTLGITLPDDYRAFLSLYGAGIFYGHTILGLRQLEFLGNDLPYFKEQSEDFRKLLGSEYANIIIVEVDDSGNPIGFLPPDPTIFVIDHNFGGRYDLAYSFEEYLEKIIAGDPTVR